MPSRFLLPGLALVALVWTARADLVLNEIHCSPAVRTERLEFLEFFNRGTNTVEVGGWSLAEGVQYRFPAGTRVPPGGFLVVAQDPVALATRHGLSGVLGPWTGALSGNGERVTLVDDRGAVRESVDYGVGFPWPTVGGDTGNSLELLHPVLDNDLGGHWRSSVAGAQAPRETLLLPAAATWRFRKGTNEPATIAGAWRQPAFDDRAWGTGPGPVGYDPEVLGPSTSGGTRLDDMRNSYSTFYLRRALVVPEGDPAWTSLRVEALYDDGFRLWLNGTLLLSRELPEGELAFNGLSNATRESNNYQAFDVPLPAGLLRPGTNVLAVHVANVLLGSSSDCFFDCRITARTGPSGQGPTPGATNRVLAASAPPAIRQVRHLPAAPRSGQEVLITARVSDPDGVDPVSGVRLAYQVVEPGGYLRFDAPEFATRRVEVPMLDTGTDGDAVAGDGLFTARLPAALQQHRRLVRYWITATDAGAGRPESVTVPYADDAGRNFAYFVWDGAPAWSGAIRPGAAGALGEVFTVEATEMNRLPSLHLLARRSDVEDATWRDRSRGDEYFWTGTLVYDGEVYDHIRFRPRGGVWRYAMGKNMWKFDFNPARDLRMRDAWGRRLEVGWSKLNLGACIQQGDYLHRGEQGMFESTGFRLFQLAGQPAMDTAPVQLRIIDEAEEVKPADPYGGDLWGLYLAVEQPDGRFLAARGLPDGNFYKMEQGFGDANNLGPDGPADASDLRAFLNAYNNPASLTEDWWRSRFNLRAYFNYQAILQGIHHYDIADGKNYFYYRDPEADRWMVVPWDLDLTWSDNMYRGGQTGGDEPFKSRLLNNFTTAGVRHPAILREFRNRVRELRDLLWNTDEAWRLLDEQARLLRGTAPRSFLEVDRALWDYHPVMNDGSLVNLGKAGWGRFYQSGVGTRDFAGMVLKMKQYVGYRATNATFSLDTLAAEPGVPATPPVTFTGTPGFPVNDLRFEAGAYAGTAGPRSLAWRIAEVTRPGHPAYDPTRPLPYEIQAVWESGERPAGDRALTLPMAVVQVGRLYRVRARYTDQEGRTSRWSPPVEFTAALPPGAGAPFTRLAVTEVMYNPAPDGFEFLEFRNADPALPLDLGGVTLAGGITFAFPPGSLLAAGAHGLVLRTTDLEAFRRFHQLGPEIPIFGSYAGALGNEGETVEVRAAAGGGVLRFAFGITNGWPALANGSGPSLVPREETTADPTRPEAWRASTQPGGSPGRVDPPPAPTAPEFGPARLENTTWVVPLLAAPGQRVVIEAADTLGPWQPLATNIGPAEIRLPVDATATARFLRARQ